MAELSDMNISSGTVEDRASSTNQDNLAKINLCKKIRRAAFNGNVTIDSSAFSTNQPMFDFIKLCGMTVREFLINYLKYLQPYAIERLTEQGFDKDIICIVQFDYSYPLYIKVKITQFKEVVISFHENQIKNVSKYKKRNLPMYSVLICDEALERGKARCILPRGFVNLDIIVLDNDNCGYVKILTRYVTDVYLYYLNDRLASIMDGQNYEGFSSVKQASITSYGDSDLNTISCLLEYFKSLPRNNVSEIQAVGDLLVYYCSTVLSEDCLLALRDRYATDATIQRILGGISNGRIGI